MHFFYFFLHLNVHLNITLPHEIIHCLNHDILPTFYPIAFKFGYVIGDQVKMIGIEFQLYPTYACRLHM